MTNLDAIRSLDAHQMAVYLKEKIFDSENLFDDCPTCWHPQSMGACTCCVERWLSKEVEDPPQWMKDQNTGWQKEQPTADGLYVVAYTSFMVPDRVLYATAELENGKLFYTQRQKVERDIIGWKRIAPMKVVKDEHV